MLTPMSMDSSEIATAADRGRLGRMLAEKRSKKVLDKLAMPSVSSRHMSHATPLLMTQAQAAKALGVSVDTLRSWTRSGAIRAVRPHGFLRLRYRRSDIEAFSAELEAAE